MEQFDNNDLEVSSFLPIGIASDGTSALVCGKTETAINWAEKFLKYGFITAIQFKEIPEKLQKYKENIRFIFDDFEKGDKLSNLLIVAIATGNIELNQILAVKYHEEDVRLIVSETPGPYINAKFLNENNDLKVSLTESNSEDEKVIKVGYFNDDLENYSIADSLKKLGEKFPDFKFELIHLDDYDSKKYNIDKYGHESLNDKVNNQFIRGHSALYKEDVDIIFVDGKTIPNYDLKDLNYWPNLIERDLNEPIIVIPEEFKNWEDVPKDYKFYVNYWPFETQLINFYFDDLDFSDYPEFKEFKNLSEINKIRKDNPNSVFITSYPELVSNGPEILNDIKENNYKLKPIGLSSIPLDGFTVGLSRKDNKSESLKRLEDAVNNINSDQKEIFKAEQNFKKKLEPTFGSFFDFVYSGGFTSLEEGYYFNGFAITKHGRILLPEDFKPKPLEEAIDDMNKFIDYANTIWNIIYGNLWQL